MNPPRNSNQIPTTAQPVNPVMNQQMRMLNPQQMCNGTVGGFIPNNRPNQNPPYMNGPNPNQPFPLQFPLGQFHNGMGGFAQQQNFNSFAVNQQQNNQLFTHNLMNVTPFYNPNVSLPNGHLPQPNMLQNVNQFMQLQNPNYPQYVPGNFPMFQSQVAQNRGPQNPNILVNQQFCLPNSYGPMQHVSQEQQRFVSPITDVNALKQSPMMNQQLQESSGLPHASGSIQRQETQKPYPTTSNFQENQGENEPTYVNSKWVDSKRQNFNRHGKNNASQKGFKSRFQHTKGKFGNVNKNIGFRGDAATNPVLANSTNQFHSKKKVLTLNYTEQEIQQWREDRKKHYPSRANMEQKLTEKQTLPEVTDQATKLRCQQLKEILAKQAELGCEVAEIPPSYLSDSEKQRGKENEGARNDKRKRGKSHKFDRFGKKKQRSENQNNNDSCKANNNNNNQNNKREPSLLQKLLTQDIKRDKSHILQVLRFIKLNSFFNEDPQKKSLKFPSVIVKEIGSSEGKLVQVKSSLVSSKEKLEEEEGEIVDFSP